MNRKITFPQLADAVARLTSGTPATAELFLKHLFELISDTLAKGETVTVKGIGTFTPGDNPGSPVTWTPDKELAEAVNEPFAFFDPVPLGEGVTEDTLEAADAVIDDTTAMEESIAALPVIPPIPPVPSMPSIPPIPKSNPADDAQPADAPDIPDAETPHEEEEIVAEETTVTEEPQEVKPQEEDTSTAETDNGAPAYDAEPEYAEEPRRRFNPWLAFAIGVITGLLLYFVIDRYLIFSDSEGKPAETTMTENDTVTALAPAIESPGTTTITVSDTIKAFKPIALDTISTSRYLTTMARKYYGDYKFWVYIYEENSDIITNPNRIRPGTVVKIPDPEKYDINVNDPESHRRAEKKIGEISARLAK